jgi:hypothetical protein
MRRSELITGFALLPLAACASRTSQLYVPRRQQSHEIDLTPKLRVARTSIFPRPRPDGTIPSRKASPQRTPELVMPPCTIDTCSTPAPAPTPTQIHEFTYDNNATYYTYGNQSYNEVYYNGTLDHQTYYGEVNSDGSLPIKVVGRVQTVSATLLAVGSIPIDVDVTVGNRRGHVYSANNTATITDSQGSVIPISYDGTTNRYLMRPPNHTQIIVVPPRWGSACCALFGSRVSGSNVPWTSPRGA